MPIIEESMMDTNVGAAQVPNADVGVGQGLQTFGNTLSEILLDMNARRTETETKNYLGAYGHVSSMQEEQLYQTIKSDPTLNWNSDGNRIKSNFLENMKKIQSDFEMKAPNDVAKREMRLQADKDNVTTTLKLDALHSQKVLETNEKLYTEIGGSSIASMPFGVDAATADQSYKKTATDLLKLGQVPFSTPDKIRDREKWYVTNYTEKFVQDGAISNPLQTLRTLSPDVARYLELSMNKGMTSVDNGLADIAYKGADGRFYQIQYNAASNSYISKPSSLDPSLHKGAFLVNLSKGETELTEAQVMSSPQTPHFVKELIRLNPEKFVEYTKLLMGKTLVRKKEDVSLNKQAVKDTYDNTMSGKLISKDFDRIAPIPEDEALFKSQNAMDNVELTHKFFAPFIIGNAVFELKKNPTMDVADVDNIAKSVRQSFTDIANDTESPKVQAIFAKLSPTGDVEEGRAIYKEHSRNLVEKTIEEIKAKQDIFKGEFKKDPGAYVRSIRTPEDQTRYDNYFGGPDPLIFKDEVSTSEMQKLKTLATEDQLQLKRFNNDLGLSSSIMKKEEEQKITEYIKANTSNPEKITTAITRIEEVMGNKATAEFLDRSGLGLYRSIFATESFALQSDISGAFKDYSENKKLLQTTMSESDYKTVYENINKEDSLKTLITTLGVGAGSNTKATTSSVKSAVEALTFQNMVKDKMDKKTAIKKAVERITQEFDIVSDGTNQKSTYHLFAKKGGMLNTQKVERWISERGLSKEYLEKKALVIGEGFRKDNKRLSQKELKDKWVSFIVSNGVWSTNSNGDGARLSYRDPQTKQLVPVLSERLDGDKDYVEKKYKEINEAYDTIEKAKTSFFDDASQAVSSGWDFIKNKIGLSKVEKSSKGAQGLAPDTKIEESAAANDVDEDWINDTMNSEGESLLYADKTYTFDRLYATKDDKGFLHSMRQSNFAFINSPVQKQKTGGSTIYEYDYNGKKVISYLPLPPEKWNALTKEEQKEYFPTIEKAIKQTMTAWTKSSTNPEVATFMKGKSITQNEFFGIADLWHVFGGSKLQGISKKGYKLDPAYKKLGDLLKQKKWGEALKFIRKDPLLNREAGLNKHRFDRLNKYFGGTDV